MRQVLFRADGVQPVGVEIAILVGLGAVFLVGAEWCLDYLERKSREEGRLTVRWE